MLCLVASIRSSRRDEGSITKIGAGYGIPSKTSGANGFACAPKNPEHPGECRNRIRRPYDEEGNGCT